MSKIEWMELTPDNILPDTIVAIGYVSGKVRYSISGAVINNKTYYYAYDEGNLEIISRFFRPTIEAAIKDISN